jgi:hypothetical protein
MLIKHFRVRRAKISGRHGIQPAFYEVFLATSKSHFQFQVIIIGLDGKGETRREGEKL